VVDHGLICGVMVKVLASSVVDHGLICGVMVRVLASSVVDHGFEIQIWSSQRLLN
jgi:MOSC domain-containing protein YiiM